LPPKPNTAHSVFRLFPRIELPHAALEQKGHSLLVTQEVAESMPSRRPLGKYLKRDQPAHLQEESIEGDIPVKLHTPKRALTEVYVA
jgi:hypothetical protein